MPQEEMDFPTAVPVEHDAEIGRVARTWGHLEYLIDLTIWEAAQVEQQFGACITAQIVSASFKLRALTALVRLRGGTAKLLSDLESFQGAIYGTIEKRNRIVHDPRFVKQGTTDVVRWQTTATAKEIRFGPNAETLADVKAVRVEAARRVRTFMGLRDRIIAELQASFETQQLQLTRVVPLRASEESPTKT